MQEEDIRKLELMEENHRLRTADVKTLLGDKKSFVNSSCPACNSRINRKLFTKGGFRFVECKKCQTVFVNPKPSKKQLDSFYRESKSIQHWNDEIYPASEGVRKQKIFKPRVKKVIALCKKHKAGKKLILDVGAGFGTFGVEIKKLKFFSSVVVVEPAKSLAETCRHKGLEVIEKTIETVDLRQKANVITNFELIEHLFSPKKFISACKSLLSPKGLLILTTPNIKGFDLMMLGKKSDNMTAPNHLTFFHPKSLELLLQNAGLKVLEIITPGKLDAELVRKSALKDDFDVKKHPFLEEVLINNWEKIGKPFQNFLANNNLSSHMWVVAQKK